MLVGGVQFCEVVGDVAVWSFMIAAAVRDLHFLCAREVGREELGASANAVTTSLHTSLELVGQVSSHFS